MSDEHNLDRRYNAKDLAEILGCSYSSALTKLFRNGYYRKKNRKGHYDFTRKEFGKVVQHLCQKGT